MKQTGQCKDIELSQQYEKKQDKGDVEVLSCDPFIDKEPCGTNHNGNKVEYPIGKNSHG